MAAAIDSPQPASTADDPDELEDASSLPRIRGMEPAEVRKLRKQWMKPDPEREAIHARRRQEAKAWKAYRQSHPDAPNPRAQRTSY